MDKNKVYFTRKDYMEKQCSHRDYYAQFVTDEIKHVVMRMIGATKLMNSKNIHLNDIPLCYWDATIQATKTLIHAVKERGDWLSKAGWVCIAKEAARQIIEERKEESNSRRD